MPLELLDAAACSAAELAAALRESLLEKHHGGLLLFTHPDERSVLASLLALAAQLPAGQEKHVLPASSPEATAVLYKLAKRLTAGYAMAVGLHPYALYPGLDTLDELASPFASLEDGSARTASRLLANNSKGVPEHIDRGLFNMVLGTKRDLSFLRVRLGAGAGAVAVPVSDLLPPSAGDSALLLLAIPGYTAQHLPDSSLPISAVLHEVVCGASDQRSTVTLQWRLSPDFLLGATTVGELSSQLESVRMPGAPLPSSSETVQPVLPPQPGFSVRIKNSMGQTHTIPANPQWSCLELKCVVQERTGVPVGLMRLVFDGRELVDERTIEDSGIQHESVLYLVMNLRGD